MSIIEIALKRVCRGTARLLLVCVLSGVALSTFSQEQQEDKASGVPNQNIPVSKPVNLQVLPKNTSATALGRLMKRYEKDLGVTCSYCHVENRDTQKLDYASDENPAKQTARIMIAMLDDINDKHLAQLAGDRRYAVPVSCGSCHLGRANPPEFEAGRR